MLAKQAGLAVEGWHNRLSPTLDGKPIELGRYERSRSLAIHPDAGRLVLGAEWSPQAIGANGERLWRRGAPSIVWGGGVTSAVTVDWWSRPMATAPSVGTAWTMAANC
jgi:hypothetical protein